MKSTILAVALILAQILSQAGTGEIPTPNPAHGKFYIGPCDLVTCAEAYSMTRAMLRSYSGPLFQIYNGSTTKNIGQTANHTADMSTWSAFCSGVQSNCVVSAIYAQINSSNNLVPSTVNAPAGSNCTGGGNYKCAAPFTIDQNGLPVLLTIVPYSYYVGTAGSDDTASTGITSGGAALSIIYSIYGLQVNYCCGNFGMTHKYNSGDVSGTDFSLAAGFGWANAGGSGVNLNCSTATTWCFAVDMEGAASPFYQATAGLSLQTSIFGGTYNPTGTLTTLYLNGSSVGSSSASGAIAPGVFIHLGGGGDLGQNPSANITDDIRMREALITNSVLTSAQHLAVYNNMNSFYRAIVPAYQGIGDVAGSAASYVGLRAYSNATLGQKAINIVRASDSRTCDVLTAAATGLGNTANCSNSADNGTAVTTWCNGTTCTIAELYDQTGNGNSLTQATVANQPTLTFNCLANSLPCATFGSTLSLNDATCAVSNSPATVGWLAERTGGTTSLGWPYTLCLGAHTNGVFFNNTINAIACNTGTNAGDIKTGTDNVWHSAICALPGTGTMNLTIDAVNDGSVSSTWTFSTGTDFSGDFIGPFLEGFAYGSQLSVATMQAMCRNQSLYLTAPAC